jgi:hypothetical protein
VSHIRNKTFFFTYFPCIDSLIVLKLIISYCSIMSLSLILYLEGREFKSSDDHMVFFIVKYLFSSILLEFEFSKLKILVQNLNLI